MTTQGKHAQPKALRLAESIERMDALTWYQRDELRKAAAELRRLHAYAQELESQVIADCMTHDAQPAAPQGVAYADMPEPAPVLMREQDFEDLKRCYWIAMRECEGKADDNEDPVLRHQVEGFYRLWARITGQELKPRWVERADRADRTHALRASHGQAPAASPWKDHQPAAAGNTGHDEADQIINRLMSSDPDFEDCMRAAMLIQREIKGPDGYPTWRDAAVAARAARAPADSVLEDAARLTSIRLTSITQAIRDYHFALDNRKHGSDAARHAVFDIERIVGMRWKQGEEAARRAARKQGGM